MSLARAICIRFDCIGRHVAGEERGAGATLLLAVEIPNHCCEFTWKRMVEMEGSVGMEGIDSWDGWRSRMSWKSWKGWKSWKSACVLLPSVFPCQNSLNFGLIKTDSRSNSFKVREERETTIEFYLYFN